MEVQPTELVGKNYVTLSLGCNFAEKGTQLVINLPISFASRVNCDIQVYIIRGLAAPCPATH